MMGLLASNLFMMFYTIKTVIVPQFVKAGVATLILQ